MVIFVNRSIPSLRFAMRSTMDWVHLPYIYHPQNTCTNYSFELDSTSFIEFFTGILSVFKKLGGCLVGLGFSGAHSCAKLVAFQGKLIKPSLEIQDR